MLCRTAANFIHDAAQDSLRFPTKIMACLTVARRAIWLCNWPLELHMKDQMLSIPYCGILFGDCLEHLCKDYVRRKRSFCQLKRKKYCSSSFHYCPHHCHTFCKLPTRLKRGKVLHVLSCESCERV